MKLVLAETENLPSEEPSSILTTSVNTYTDKFNGYDTALKASAVNPATVSVTATDAGRDDAWRGANAYVKAMCNHPTADVASAAAEAKSLFDKYGDPTSLATICYKTWKRSIPRSALRSPSTYGLPT